MPGTRGAKEVEGAEGVEEVEGVSMSPPWPHNGRHGQVQRGVGRGVHNARYGCYDSDGQVGRRAKRAGGRSPRPGVTLGSDFLQLDIADAPPGGRTAWLADRLRSAIADGRLPVGTRLPASRVLAEELRVTRGVVTEAYRRLSESGQIAGRGRGGTVVVAAPARPAPPATPPTAPSASDRPASPSSPAAGQRASRPRTPRTPTTPDAFFTASPHRDGLVDALRGLPCRIDLSPGVPDLAAFPRTAWLRAERAVLAAATPADFGYGSPQGAPALRRAVVGWLARNRGIRADPDEVVVVAGVAQALGLLAQLLHADGVDHVAVEDPARSARASSWSTAATRPSPSPWTPAAWTSTPCRPAAPGRC